MRYKNGCAKGKIGPTCAQRLQEELKLMSRCEKDRRLGVTEPRIITSTSATHLDVSVQPLKLGKVDAPTLVGVKDVFH